MKLRIVEVDHYSEYEDKIIQMYKIQILVFFYFWKDVSYEFVTRYFNTVKNAESYIFANYLKFQKEKVIKTYSF